MKFLSQKITSSEYNSLHWLNTMSHYHSSKDKILCLAVPFQTLMNTIRCCLANLLS